MSAGYSRGSQGAVEAAGGGAEGAVLVVTTAGSGAPVRFVRRGFHDPQSCMIDGDFGAA